MVTGSHSRQFLIASHARYTGHSYDFITRFLPHGKGTHDKALEMSVCEA